MHTRQALLGHVSNGMKKDARDLHNCDFDNALSVQNSAGAPLDPAEAVHFYLRAIQESVVYKMHNMPQMARATQAEVD